LHVKKEKVAKNTNSVCCLEQAPNHRRRK